MLMRMNYDRGLLDPPASSRTSLLEAKPPQSPMHGMGMDGGLGGGGGIGGAGAGGVGGAGAGMDKGFGSGMGMDDQNKENANTYGPNGSSSGGGSGGSGGTGDGLDDGSDGEPPAVVIYMVDPFSFGIDNCDLMRLSSLALLRCFQQIVPVLPEALRNNIFLQTVSLESIFEVTESPARATAPKALRGMAFSVYSQAQRPMVYGKDCKTLTGFGPASNAERFFKDHEERTKLVRYLHQPPFVLAPPPGKKKLSDSSEAGGGGGGSSSNSASNANSSSTQPSSAERSPTVLYVNYCLSEDQRWLLASAADERGELCRTNVINVDIPNRAQRKKASARRVGLRRLFDWIVGVMALSLNPWRLVVGRIGRIGHGELRGWSVLLGRKSLRRAAKQLREVCSWSSDVPTILSACLVSLEPDSSLRLMADQFTPDERFGQTASHCQLSTPKDASATHVLVFPTSATAQVR